MENKNKDGFTLCLTNGEGEVIASWGLDGYALDKPIARAALIGEIESSVAEARAPESDDSGGTERCIDSGEGTRLGTTSPKIILRVTEARAPESDDAGE